MFILEGIVYIYCLLAIIGAFVFYIKAMKYRTEDAVGLYILSERLHPGMKIWANPKGRRYNRIGGILLCSATVLLLFGIIVLHALR